MSEEIKAFNMRMPKDLWAFLKRMAAEDETSMTDIIVKCVRKYKTKIEKKLTECDTSV